MTSLFCYLIVNERWQANLPRGVHVTDAPRKICGADRDRTDDLRLAKPALSQLSYSPASWDTQRPCGASEAGSGPADPTRTCGPGQS